MDHKLNVDLNIYTCLRLFMYPFAFPCDLKLGAWPYLCSGPYRKTERVVKNLKQHQCQNVEVCGKGAGTFGNDRIAKATIVRKLCGRKVMYVVGPSVRQYTRKIDAKMNESKQSSTA